MNLKGKNVLITGGSRGIGAGIVTFLAQQGARIAFTYTSRLEAAQSILQSLPNQCQSQGQNHALFQMDISNESSVCETVAKILAEFSPLHGLVNNAGITKDQLLLKMKTADFDEVIQTNLRGTYLCTKSVLKSMIKARQGSIINLTSVIGQKGNLGQSNYAASKAGIEGFSKSIAQEVGRRHIRVNCVAPGFIETEMTHELSENHRTDILQSIPLGRMGQVSDISQVVAFLLSDGATYITGQTISVNGGLYM